MLESLMARLDNLPCGPQLRRMLENAFGHRWLHLICAMGSLQLLLLSEPLNAQETRPPVRMACQGTDELAQRIARCHAHVRAYPSDAAARLDLAHLLIEGHDDRAAADLLEAVLTITPVSDVWRHEAIAKALIRLAERDYSDRSRIRLIIAKQASRLHFARALPRSTRVPVVCSLYEATAAFAGKSACDRAAHGDSSAFPIHGETISSAVQTAIQPAARDDLSDTLFRRVASTGSGFYITADGHFLSNAHVIEGCGLVTVRTLTGDRVRVALVASTAELDIAILRAPIEQASSVAALRTVPSARAGESVVVAGYPLHGFLADQLNVTTGVVSALAGVGNNVSRMQLTAPVQPGSSGGPVFDASGNVIGQVVSKLDALAAVRATGDIAQNVNFAIKSSTLRAYLLEKGIKPFSSVRTAKLESADIGDIGRNITRLVECWR
jgi:S1-C subfamily serine protease